MKYKIIDLFSGIGGIRKGFELTEKFINVLSAEVDNFACKTYEHLFGENPKNDVTSDQFKARLKQINYDVLLAGFPCQAFSAVGKKEGFRDKTRGTLFFDIADIIETTRPKSFLLENVQGLITHKNGTTFKTILETLVFELNYKVVGVSIDDEGNLKYNSRCFILNSKNFGVPQNRPRVYIVGFNREIYGELIDNIPFFQLPTTREREAIYKSATDILDKNVPEKYYLSQGYLETLKKHKKTQKEKGNGFGYSVINRIGINNPISNAILATGGSGKERNLVYSPREGISGNIVKNKKTPLNNEFIRTMTPREWGRLQGFIGYAFINSEGEDTFTYPEGISDTQLYKQFGNSVTIPVIEEIAFKIGNTLDFLELNKSKISYTDKSYEKVAQ